MSTALTDGRAGHFTADEIDALIATAGDLYREYGDDNDVLSARQRDLAERAYGLLGQLSCSCGEASADEPGHDDNNGHNCGECGWTVPASEPSMISVHHAGSCSLHPGNVTAGGGQR